MESVVMDENKTASAVNALGPPNKLELPDDVWDRVDLRKAFPGRENENPVMVPCIAHKDGLKPNLGIYRNNVYCFHPLCGYKAGALDFIKRYYRCSGRTALKRVLELCGDAKQPAPEGPLSPLNDVLALEYARRMNSERAVWLRQKYGLTPQTVGDARLGHTGRAPHAYTVPVYNLQNELINIRFRSDPTAGENPGHKYWGLEGRNRAMLYFPPSLRGDTLVGALTSHYGSNVVVLTEGEFDSLALCQIGVPAISATNGAKALTGRYEGLCDTFKGCAVWVCYDMDEVGAEYGTRAVATLRSRGVKASRLIWDACHGKDASEMVANGATRADFRAVLKVGSAVPM